MKIFWLFLLFTFVNPALADENSLTLGIIPYVTTSKIIFHNNVIKKHLNNTTPYDISLVSAKNMKTYIQNIKKYDYDIILSAPHIARYAELKYKYQRIAMSTHTIRGVYITKKSSDIFSIADIKGKTVSLIPPKSLIHQLVLEQTIENGINPSKDMKIKRVKTFNNAIYDVINGYSDVAVTGIKIWQELPDKVRKNLKKIGQTKPTSGFILLAKPSLSKPLIKTLQSSLLAFNDTADAKKYIFQGFKLIKDSDMQSLNFHAKAFE